MTRTLTFAAFALALLAGPAPVMAQSVPSAAAFAEPPAFHDIVLSPDGRRIAKITQRDSLFFIEVWTVGEAQPSAVYDFGPARSPNWIRWRDNERLLVSLGIPSERFGFLLNEARLISFTANLDRPVMLNNLRGRRSDPPYQDQIAFLSADPEGPLILQIGFESGVHPGLYNADANNGRLTLFRRGNAEVVDWIFDHQGRPVYGVGDPFRDRAALYRPRENDWVVDPITLPPSAEGAVFTPLGVDGSPERLIVASNHEGGTTGLYVFDLNQGAFTQTLFKHPRYDVARVVMTPGGDRAVGAIYVADVAHTVYFDDQARARAEGIAGLVDAEEVEILEQTQDGRYVVASAVVDSRDHETWWIDTQTSQRVSLGSADSALGGFRRSPTASVTYRARDGVEIPAYVTLPPGYTRETARNLPFVVMPHGGPHARDDASFDFLAQFVASRGYGVLQPNFRGSSGYGEEFRRAGEREWGGAILNDVEDGARWIVSEGMADASRMCVVGWSFGGYVALMAAVELDDLFRCASATAPVTDLPDLIQYQERFYGGDQVMRQMIGRAWRDRSRLTTESPARRAADIDIPVLLVHGTIDDVVPIEQSRKMARALTQANRPVTFLSLDWADHSIAREGDRRRFLEALEAFLAANLTERPGAATAAPG